MKPKKVPIRQCTACRTGKPKRELLRIVRSPEGEIAVDFTGKANGRGAYICPTIYCFELAFKQKGLERSFKQNVPAEIYTQLKAEMEEFND